MPVGAGFWGHRGGWNRHGLSPKTHWGMNQNQKFGSDLELDLCLAMTSYRTSFEFPPMLRRTPGGSLWAIKDKPECLAPSILGQQVLERICCLHVPGIINATNLLAQCPLEIILCAEAISKNAHSPRGIIRPGKGFCLRTRDVMPSRGVTSAQLQEFITFLTPAFHRIREPSSTAPLKPCCNHRQLIAPYFLKK